MARACDQEHAHEIPECARRWCGAQLGVRAAMRVRMRSHRLLDARGGCPCVRASPGRPRLLPFYTLL